MHFPALAVTVALVGLLAAPVRAQQAPQTLNDYFRAQKRNDDIGFGPGVLFRSDTVRTDGTLGGVVRKYYPSGNKYEEVPYANLRKSELQGRQTRWFENGQVQATEDYAAGRRQGRLDTFYPDGTARRREEFDQGQNLRAECFTATGQPTGCLEYITFPEYPGGLNALLSQIAARTRYPRALIRKGIQGQVLVDFVIDSTGAVTNAHVRRSVAPELDAEALRVVNSLRGWTPGRLDGEPTNVLFTLPVTFKIQ